MKRWLRVLGLGMLIIVDPIQAHGAPTMQNVLELIVIDAHATRGLFEWQAFANDQAHGRPIKRGLGVDVLLVMHDSLPTGDGASLAL